MLDTIHLNEHLIQVPLRADACSLLSQPGSVERAKRVAPLSNRFIRDLNTSLRQHLLDVPVAQSKTVVQPYALFHYFDRKAVTAIRLSAALIALASHP
jgi:hypothetical protein